MALIIPVFAILALLSFMVMPGMVYSGEHKARYIGVAKKLFDLYSEHYRTAILISVVCLPVIFLECLLGLYQRGTESKAGKVVCHLIAVLGIVLAAGLYFHFTYEN